MLMAVGGVDIVVVSEVMVTDVCGWGYAHDSSWSYAHG